MRLLVLGGTGSLGQLIVADAVHRGHMVTVLARNLPRMPPMSGVPVVQGNALDDLAVTRALIEQDAVIYSLGPNGPGRTTWFSECTRILLAAMEREHVSRLVAITGVGAGDTKGHGGFLYDRVFYPLFTRQIYEDKDRQEALIRSSAAQWTIVRPAAFRERRQPRAPLQAATDLDGVTLRSINRSQVATFVLDEVERGRYVRQSPFIGHA
jgi:putative NADH-flavin reductase